MAPLIMLLVTFLIASLARRSWKNGFNGRLAMAVMLFVTGSSHFATTASFVAMLPLDAAPAMVLVYVTGALEIALGVALLLGRRPRVVGWVAALFFLTLLPANVYSALAETGLSGHGPSYLWFRVPLQFFFIGWALWFTTARGRRLRLLRLSTEDLPIDSASGVRAR